MKKALKNYFINEKVPNKLCVVFYGYCADLAGQYHGFANSGHAKLSRILKNKKVQKEMAEAITEGILEYLKKRGK